MTIPQDVRCGTVAGYNVHTKRREQPCADCRQAQTEYAKEWRHRTKRSTSKLYTEAEIRDIQAQALRDAADEQSRRSETLLKTMEGMVGAGYGSEDILRYGAFSAEAQTTAYRLRARADRLTTQEPR